MQNAEEDDKLSEIYGRFFDEDGEARSDEPIPIAKMVQLFRSSDPRIRSKVARLVGKYGQYQAFIARRLQEDDPRVRSNAIESLWGVDTPVARRALEAAVSDSNHRARINAIYGLYLLGNCTSIRLLLKQARHFSASFRVAAVWAMGQTADPRFASIVQEMANDADESVRRVAALSAARVEARLAAENQKATFRPRILRARGPDPDSRTVTMLLPREIAESVKPTDFVIEENGQPIFIFDVGHVTARVPLRLGIAIPEAKANSSWVADAEAALKQSLAEVGRKDAFAVIRYSTGERRPAYSAQGLRAGYTTRPDLLAEQLGVQVSAGELQETLKELLGNLFAPLEAERALLLFAETDPEGTDAPRFCPDPEVTAGLRGKHVPLHVIARADGEGNPLESASATLGGIFLTAGNTQGLQQACSTVFNSFSDRFEIRYSCERPFTPGSTVKITVYSPNAWGEDTHVLL
jgi:HEAT repeat protein